MKAIDLQGNEFVWNLGKYVGKKSTNPSRLHVRVREFLAEQYPGTSVLEEVVICDQLKLDFFIPLLKIAVEAQGLQHSEYVPHFHGIHKQGFYKSRGRDNKKAEFCELNNIRLIYFYESESNDEWEEKLC